MKTLTVEDLKLTDEEMDALISGARIFLPPEDPQEDETSLLTGAQKSEP
jgi:hypothetical protein